MNNAKNLLRLPCYFRTSFYAQNFSSVATLQFNLTGNIVQSILQNNILKFKSHRMKNTKIISHRGRSDLYPENTLESISQALLTSDLAQFDVMLTKDNEVIVFHDRFLGQLTNIAFMTEFENRKTLNDLNEYGEVPHAEWWVKQFTLEELRQLCVRQKHPTRPQIMEKEFHIPTLDQLIKKALEVKSTLEKTNNSGLLIQIKTQRQNFKTLPRDLILLQKINEILKSNHLDSKQKCEQMNLPIIVQSFNHEAVRKFHDICPALPMVHLYSDEDQNVSQEYIAKHRTISSIGVGISTKHLTRQFVEICHKMKYEIFYWSVVDDKPQIPLGCKSYQEFYQNLKSFNVDGIITDFAANCKNALSALIM